MSDENNVAKIFSAILEDINNNRMTTKPVSVKSHSSNINLRPLIKKLQNTKISKWCSEKIMDLMKHLKHKQCHL